MKRSSKILFALLLITVLLLYIGSVGAYMRKQTEVVENVFIPAEFLNDDCVVAHLYDVRNNFLRFSVQHGMDIADAIKYYSSNNCFMDRNVIKVHYIVLTKRNVVLKSLDIFKWFGFYIYWGSISI